MSDADCTPGREPRSVAASLFKFQLQLSYVVQVSKLHNSDWRAGGRRTELSAATSMADCDQQRRRTDGPAAAA